MLYNKIQGCRGQNRAGEVSKFKFRSLSLICAVLHLSSISGRSSKQKNSKSGKVSCYDHLWWKTIIKIVKIKKNSEAQTYIRSTWPRNFREKSVTEIFETKVWQPHAYFLFTRSWQEGRPWGASTGGLAHTAARIKRTEGRGRSSLSARYKAMRTSRSNQYRLWH